MQLVFNPSLSDSVVYSDTGQMVAPQEWAYVDEDVDTRVTPLLEAGKLVLVEVPAEMPASVTPAAAEALQAAISDRDGGEDDFVNPPQTDGSQLPGGDAPDDTSKTENQQVRNTGTRNRKTNQNKEG